MHIVVESYGCTMNQGEAEDMARKLAALGHSARHAARDSGEWRDADIIVLATCIVIEKTERNMLKRMRETVAGGKRLIVTGCLPAGREELLEDFPGVDHCGPGQWRKVLRFIENYEQTMKTASAGNERSRAGDSAGESGSRLNPVTHILPIAQGCLGACAYCITRRARGKLVSRPVEEIVREAAAAIREGVREIQITAQDTAAYGRDIGTSLPELLGHIVGIGRNDEDSKHGSPDFRVRVGMMNPCNVTPILDDLIEVFRDPGIFTFFHIPVQSGDDEILEKMNRGYDVKGFEAIVKRIRDAFGDEVSISTDIVAGFPGETREEFGRSVELIRRVRPDTLNVTRFSPRPHTPAAALRPTVHGWEIKEWSRELSRLRFEIARERNGRLVGRQFRVLLLEEGYGDVIIGRTGFYKSVILPAAALPGGGGSGKGIDPRIGDFVDLLITGAADTYLEGKMSVTPMPGPGKT